MQKAQFNTKYYLYFLVDLFKHSWNYILTFNGLDLISQRPNVLQKDLFAFCIDTCN